MKRPTHFPNKWVGTDNKTCVPNSEEWPKNSTEKSGVQVCADLPFTVDLISSKQWDIIGSRCPVENWRPWWWSVQTVSWWKLPRNCGNKWKSLKWTQTFIQSLRYQASYHHHLRWAETQTQVKWWNALEWKKERLQVCPNWKLLAYRN